MGSLTKNDFLCINIGCDNTLSDYEVGRQNRSRKYRFCLHCRNKNKEFRWTCKSCKKIMTSVSNVSGKYYCKSTCKAIQISDSVAHAI